MVEVGILTIGAIQVHFPFLFYANQLLTYLLTYLLLLWSKRTGGCRAAGSSRRSVRSNTERVRLESDDRRLVRIAWYVVGAVEVVWVVVGVSGRMERPLGDAAVHRAAHCQTQQQFRSLFTLIIIIINVKKLQFIHMLTATDLRTSKTAKITKLFY